MSSQSCEQNPIPESERSDCMARPFVILKPGGNDTGLVIVPNTKTLTAKIRGEINNALMTADPTIEQVGFVTVTGPNIQLMMAGGEFCGNATRSAAYLALDGKPGERLIQVSGVNRLLKAGVTKNGDAYAEMPIKKDPSSLQMDGNNIIVPMEGIIQYISFDTEGIETLSEKDLKQQAENILIAKNLMDAPAAGVIYAKKIGNDQWQITPVVRVAAINTLFAETACGSGTIALAQALSYLRQKSVENISILQPSGSVINATVLFEKENGFTEGFISGPIQKRYRGVINKENTVIQFQSIRDKETLEQYKEQLYELYQKECFGQVPYFESFLPEEVLSFFTEYLEKGFITCAFDKKTLIGFTGIQPLDTIPELAKFLTERGVPADAIYFADLGVRISYRKQKIAEGLIKKALEPVKGKPIIMRTNEKNEGSQKAFAKNGFTILPDVYQDVTVLRTDGSVQTDRRLFMVKNI